MNAETKKKTVHKVYDLASLIGSSREKIKLNCSNRKKFNYTSCAGFVAIKCPDCKNCFGLDANLLIGEALMKFTCPYCGKEHSIVES